MNSHLDDTIINSVIVLPTGVDARTLRHQFETILDFALAVSFRGFDDRGRETYSIDHSAAHMAIPLQLSHKGVWAYPSAGELADFRWTDIDEAIQFAKSYVDHKWVNGQTFQDWNRTRLSGQAY